MKKLMFAAVASLCASVFADDIASDVVGYTSKAVEGSKFYLVGVQFNKAGDTSGKIDMNDLVSMSSDIVPGHYADDFVTAPQIQVLSNSGTGYNLYYYIDDATDDDDNPLGYDCWADGEGYELKDASKLEMGKGFWIKTLVDGTVTVAGQVKGEASGVATFPADTFWVVSNPFPKDFSLADVTTTGLTPGHYGDDFATAPQIQVLSASATGYDLYYYIDDATDDKDDPVGYDCWADGEGYILNGVNQVTAGSAFWIKAATAGSLGFSL